MKRSLKVLLPSFALAAVAVAIMFATAPDATAKGKPGGGGGSQCPRVGIFCADVWDPVICSDGQIYSNACYAYVACATGCTPTDGGPQPAQQ